MTSLHAPADVLRDTFGFETFRPGQEAVIDYLLSGHSAAAVFPTGSGKSLCFQLPALLLPGLTLVSSLDTSTWARMELLLLARGKK